MENRKIVCITGCTRGLGLAMAQGFARRGFLVTGGGRSEDAVENLNRQMAESGHRFHVLDVSSETSVRNFAQKVLSEIGTPDLLINNAGVINRNSVLWEVPEEEFSQVVDVNIKGTAAIIRHFLPAMIEKRKGVIVNFSSGWGRSTSPEVAPYCATKWAIEGLTQALAQELPHGLAAVALNPGVIDTEMLRSCFGAAAGGHSTATQWAETAVPFLAGISPGDNGKALTAP